MEDAIDGVADKLPIQPVDSSRGNKLPDSSILPFDRKSSAARRRRLEIRRLKSMSTFGRPDNKRLRSAISSAVSTTTTCDVATEWTVSVTGLDCKPDHSVVTRSICSLPVEDSLGLSFVQLERLAPVKTGNEGEFASGSTGSNEIQVSSATSKNCSEEVEEIHAGSSDRCQGSTGKSRMTNAADLEEPGRNGVVRHFSKDNPSLNGLSDCLDRGGSWTVESSAVSGVQPSPSSIDHSSSFSLSSVADVRPHLQASESFAGVKTIRGRRKEMEDAVTVVHRFLSVPCELIGCCKAVCGTESSRSWRYNSSDNLHFFGVYDGHGGAQVAHHCRERLHRALAEEVRIRLNADGHSLAGTWSSRNGASSRVDGWKEFWERAMSDCFLRMDQEVGGVYRRSQSDGFDDERSMSRSVSYVPEAVGSTAVVAVVSACQIIVANCGDSRAVLSRGGQAIALSVDHKPERGDEMVRIEAAGGKVILWNGYRVFGMLAMSRAIGDRFLKPFVIADPEVTCTERCEEDECLILASDGLWDVLSNEKVCEIARSCVRGGAGAQAAADCLTSAAHEKGSGDNITVVVVDLGRRHHQEPSATVL